VIISKATRSISFSSVLASVDFPDNGGPITHTVVATEGAGAGNVMYLKTSWMKAAWHASLLKYTMLLPHATVIGFLLFRKFLTFPDESSTGQVQPNSHNALAPVARSDSESDLEISTTGVNNAL